MGKEEREARREEEEEEEEEFHPEPLTTSIVFVLARESAGWERAARESGYAWVMHVSLSLSTGSSRASEMFVGFLE
jgi:hypothetical protein